MQKRDSEEGRRGAGWRLITLERVGSLGADQRRRGAADDALPNAYICRLPPYTAATPPPPDLRVFGRATTGTSTAASSSPSSEES